MVVATRLQNLVWINCGDICLQVDTARASMYAWERQVRLVAVGPSAPWVVATSCVRMGYMLLRSMNRGVWELLPDEHPLLKEGETQGHRGTFPCGLHSRVICKLEKH